MNTLAMTFDDQKIVMKQMDRCKGSWGTMSGQEGRLSDPDWKDFDRMARLTRTKANYLVLRDKLRLGEL